MTLYLHSADATAKINKIKISAAIVAVARRIRRHLPKRTVVTTKQYKSWKNQCRKLRRSCLRSYLTRGHCENPYPVGDLRRSVWVDATVSIERHFLRQSEVLAIGEVVPIPLPPAPPEEESVEEPEELPEAAKRKVNWECEAAYV